jgi:chorismate-pyruvate lyase
MAVNEAYRRQVALLIKTLPLVAAETAFAFRTFAEGWTTLFRVSQIGRSSALPSGRM